jgi:hypothetical protein
MGDPWVMLLIAESFEQKTSWIWLQHHLLQPSRQVIIKTIYTSENLGMARIEWCIVVLSWFLPLFKFVACQRFHIRNHSQPVHSNSTLIHDCPKLNEKQTYIEHLNSESISWLWKEFSDRKIHILSKALFRDGWTVTQEIFIEMKSKIMKHLRQMWTHQLESIICSA